MPLADIFNFEKQLTFYGAYHSNKANIAIHMICVPILLWSALVMAKEIPVPSGIFPQIPTYQINEYMAFDVNLPFVVSVLYLSYYLILEFFAAVLYIPQLAVIFLTANQFAKGDSVHIQQAAYIHAICWVAQFIGHGVAEGRAPALKDNLLGAVVLAPFFVHMEGLFILGYRPKFNKRLQNEIGKEISSYRRAQKQAKRDELAKKGK